MTPELAWIFSIFLAPCKAKAQFGGKIDANDPSGHSVRFPLTQKSPELCRGFQFVGGRKLEQYFATTGELNW
jgi:hypothetical protein